MRNYRNGIAAEDQAKKYIHSLGYSLIASRYKIAGAELDLIALDKNFIVFIEVKSRLIKHESYLTPSQCKRYIHAAEEFVGSHPQYNSLLIRFDLIIIINGNISEHIENAWSGWDF